MSKGKNVPIQLNQCLRDFLPLKAVHAGGQEWAGISIVRARSACIFCNLSISHSLGYVFLVSSASSSLNFGVESFQFHAGIFNAELPVDPALFGIRLVRPGCNFSL